MPAIKSVVKLQIPAGQANPAPPVGSVLGPTGIAIPDFCAQFNARTSEMHGNIIPAVITIYDDRTFTFKLKTPPASGLLKKIAKLSKGSGSPLKEKVGTITKAQLREVAEKKLPDLNTDNIEQAMKIVAGTARQMGLQIQD